MNGMLINLHSLLTIWAPEPTDGERRFLQQRFPLFAQNAAAAPDAPDILLEPLRAPSSAPLGAQHAYALYGCCVIDHRGETGVGTLHQGLPDILLIPSTPLRLLYRPRPGITRPLYGLLLFAMQLCLRRKDALIVHGAVVSRGAQTLVISGHRGTRKTQLLLTFLRHGWDYLSDDKFILHQGKAWLFEPYLYLGDHLYPQVPWLRQASPRSRLQRGAARARGRLRGLAYRHLPKRLLSPAARLLDPARRCAIEDLSPSTALCMQGIPSHGFVLLQDRRFAIEPISREKGVASLSRIDQLLFMASEPMEQLLHLYTGAEARPLDEIIERNLPDIPFARLRLSEDTALEDIHREILTCCEAPSS